MYTDDDAVWPGSGLLDVRTNMAVPNTRLRQLEHWWSRTIVGPEG